MADPNAAVRVEARDAAERLEQAAAVGRQLSLLAAEASPADPAELEPRGPGRPAGSRNKRSSKLRQMLAARGYRMPEDVLVEIAGLNERGATGVELAMRRAEQVAAWLEARTGGVPLKRDQLLGLFVGIWKEQGSAASALLPFGLEKATPDVVGGAPTVIVMPRASGPAPRPGDQARVIDVELAPPPMPGEIQRNQRLVAASPSQSDGASRTE